jgi:hypothetical protein
LSAHPSAAYVGRPRALPLLVLLAFAGWLLLRAVFGLAALARRIYIDAGEPSWTDVIGGVIFIPLAFAIVFSLMLGRGALLQLVALLPQGLQP